MAQRLVRTLCPHCKQAYEPHPEDLPEDFPQEQLAQAGGTLYRHHGCKACRQLGYQGRQGIYELLVTTNRVRQLAHDRTGTWDIKTAALDSGMRTLRQDGWIKVLSGITTVDEVLRVTKGDVVLKT
jgi:general secretion pathway protein E/type IV pilus assembly protein PilB